MTNDTTNTIKDNPQTRWIVVTGLDGSGKTTLVKNLADYYRNEKNPFGDVSQNHWAYKQILEAAIEHTK